MYRASLFLVSAWVFVLAIGCSQSDPSEPNAAARLAREEPTDSPSEPQPMPAVEDAQPIAESAPLPVESEPLAVSEAPSAAPANPVVERAAFLETAESEAAAESATVPPVELSADHAELARVKVGDPLPEAELPKVGGGTVKLSSLYGKAATVVVFWKGDRQMTLDELADLGPDVVEKFGSRGVEVVGVAVDQSASDAQQTLQTAEAEFPNLIDVDAKAFDKVGSQKLPWTLVLDADGRIVWFDLEYSLSTRRELQQALLATVR